MLGTVRSASGSSSAASPFSFTSCQPRSERCARNRSPVRASKWVVRPGRRQGGTTLVFTLRQREIVRFTVVRVYPSCERIGSFSVRAHAGVNRVRFRGRLGGRRLAEGTYRLVAQARGQETAAATVTIVIVRGKTSSAELRRARLANACSASEAHEIDAAIGAAPIGKSNDDPAVKTKGIAEPFVGAAKAVVKKAKAVPGVIGAGVEDYYSDTVVLLIVGVLLFTIVLLGTLVIQVARSLVLRD